MRTPQVHAPIQAPTLLDNYRTFGTRGEAEETAAMLRTSVQAYDPDDPCTYEAEPEGSRWVVAIREPDGYLVGKW